MKGHTYSNRNKAPDYPSKMVNHVMGLMKPRMKQKNGKVSPETSLCRKINSTLPRGERNSGKMSTLGWKS